MDYDGLIHPLQTTLIVFIGLALACPANAENWPGWRGPRGDGTSIETTVPTTWDGSTGQNIMWRVPVPNRGYASPVVWDDRIFLSTCVEATGERTLLCLDRRTGATLWQQTVLKAPLEKKHTLNSYASSTPVTDGTKVWVTFLEPDFGSRTEVTPGNLVVAAYDMQGHQNWLVRPGRFASVHGFCSSPILFEDLVIVNGDHDGDAYIVALDKQTGKTIWKRPRTNKTRSYVTPIIRHLAGRDQMVFSGSKSIVSLNPRDGSRYWIIDGPTEQYVASLVDDGKLLYMTAGFPDHHIMAIRPNGNGNVTDTHVVWHTTRGCAYVPSPIIAGKYFLVAADNGIASCFEAATGKRYWMERLGKHYSTSLVSANGLVYFTADDGETKVVRPGPQLDVVAINELGDDCYASLAISRGQIFARTVKQLVCIGTSR